MVRGEAGLAATSWHAAMALAHQLLDDADTIGMLGGARCTNEGAFAWAQLADKLGIDLRDAQLGDGLPVEVLGLPRATIDEAADAATVILIGPDLKEELPVLYLRLRDAAVRGRTKIIELSSQVTGMSRYAWRSMRHAPGMGPAEVARTLADPAVAAQVASGDVVIVAGRGNLAVSEAAALATVSAALDVVPDAKVLPALRRGNVVGALQLGLAPSSADHGALATLRAAADGRLDVLVLLGADPINDCPDADLARSAIAGARRDHLDRHVSLRVHAAGRPRVAGDRLRRADRNHDESRRPRHARQSEGHRSRYVAARLDDRDRARPGARPRLRFRNGR